MIIVEQSLNVALAVAERGGVHGEGPDLVRRPVGGADGA